MVLEVFSSRGDYRAEVTLPTFHSKEHRNREIRRTARGQSISLPSSNPTISVACNHLVPGIAKTGSRAELGTTNPNSSLMLRDRERLNIQSSIEQGVEKGGLVVWLVFAFFFKGKMNERTQSHHLKFLKYLG